MSTDIKPGQTWQWNSALPNEGGIVVTSFDGERVRFRYEDGSIDGEHYRDTEHFTERAHLVKDVDATPAPLDPKQVHVGDTVTVRFIPTGDVFTTKAYQPEDVTKPGEWVYVLGWPLNKPMGHGLGITYFEILAIEPAPEPEPVWEPEGLYAITTPTEREMRVVYAPNNEPDQVGYPWLTMRGSRWSENGVTDVRPLVVIDPAAVDVDALAKVWNAELDKGTGLRHGGLSSLGYTALRAVLAELGIEKAR